MGALGGNTQGDLDGFPVDHGEWQREMVRFQVTAAVARLSASADTLFATSFSWWNGLPESVPASRLQPDFSIGVSTGSPSAWTTAPLCAGDALRHDEKSG